MGHVPERLHSLLKLEVAKILLYDVRHRHPQACREILRRHRPLLHSVLQQCDDTVRKPFFVSRRIEFDGQFLTLGHLPEVRQIRANDGHSVSTGKMSDTAASSGGRIWHDCNARPLKQIGQSIFGDISPELDARVPGAELFDGVCVARRLGMVSAGNHQRRVRHALGDPIEGLDHELQTFICAPFSESQDTVDRSASPGEIRELGPARKDAVRAKVDVVSSIFVLQNLAIARHQHGD